LQIGEESEKISPWQMKINDRLFANPENEVR